MDQFSWGIIGPGNIAGDFANDVRLIRPAEHRISAVLSHNLDKAAAFAAREDAPLSFDDIDAFLAEGRMDAVYIATPHPLHFEDTLRCLRQGIPVLCEKPLAMNGWQVRRMVDTAVQYRTFLLEGMWIRFLPSIQRVLSLIAEDAIGRVVSIKADMSYKAPYDPESRYFDPEKGGGSLLDLGVYPVFLAHLLLGKPSSIQAVARLTDRRVDETCAAILGYGNTAYALVESSLVTQTERTATIYGERGRIHIATPWNEKPAHIVLAPYDGEAQTFPCEWEGHGLQFEAEEVYHCVRQGKLYSDHHCHQFSLDVMETMDAIRRQTHISYPADDHPPSSGHHV